jgi:hypothetical protein
MLTSGTRQPFLPQHSLGKRQWASTQVWTRRPEAPLPRVRISVWPPWCGGPPQTTFPRIGGLWRSASYGHTHLRTPKAQKSKLMIQALALFPHCYLSSFGHSHLGRQAQKFLLGHSSPFKAKTLQAALSTSPWAVASRTALFWAILSAGAA